MELVQCTLQQAQTLRNLAEQAYREAFAPFNTKEDMDEYSRANFSLERIQQELENPHSFFLLALQSGEAVGYIKLNYGPAQTELQDNTAIEIERIYLLGKCQGQGVGQKLIDFAVQKAQEENKAYVWLGVWEHNPGAIRFYERNGFYRFGQHIFKLGRDEQLDYLMRKDLAPGF